MCKRDTVSRDVGRRETGEQTPKVSQLFSFIFLSELPGEHDSVFAMIFLLSSTTADATSPGSPPNFYHQPRPYPSPIR